MKSKLFRCVSAVLAAALGASCFAFAACNDKEETTTPPTTEEEDTALPFEYYDWTYTNGEGEQAKLGYGVYVPDSYDGSTAIPLVGYIPDSGWVHRSAQEIVEGAECPEYWITEEKMAEHPAIFVVFALTETENDARVETNEVAQIFNIIDKVCEDYNVDTDRLYWTGQSMGGIVGWALNAARPDYFAATIYVGCQPGSKANSEDPMYVALLEEAAFVNQKFVYIASRYDVQAHVGQDDVRAILEENGISYGMYYELDKDEAEATNNTCKSVLDQGYTQNFFGFKFIDPNSTADSPTMNEHLRSFAYCYAIDSIFDWLFAQKKEAPPVDDALIDNETDTENTNGSEQTDTDNSEENESAA